MQVAATALLRCKDDWHPARETEVLLTRRRPPGRWHVHGGKLEAGEDFMEAAGRETWQETGTRPAALQHVATGDVDGRRLALFATFRWTGDPRVAEPDKAFEHKWVKVAEMHGESPALPSMEFCQAALVAHLAVLQAQREADVAAMKELIDAYESDDDLKECNERVERV